MVGVEKRARRVARLIKEGVTDENRGEVAAALGKHREAIEGIRSSRRPTATGRSAASARETDGVRYAGTLYRSIFSAALAAAKDLGLKKKTQNGYVFQGIVKSEFHDDQDLDVGRQIAAVVRGARR